MWRDLKQRYRHPPIALPSQIVAGGQGAEDGPRKGERLENVQRKEKEGVVGATESETGHDQRKGANHRGIEPTLADHHQSRPASTPTRSTFPQQHQTRARKSGQIGSRCILPLPGTGTQERGEPWRRKEYRKSLSKVGRSAHPQRRGTHQKQTMSL